MRILVASDRIGSLSSWRAGQVIAIGWAGDDVTVVPVGEAGHGFVEAYADAAGTPTETVADPTGLTTIAVRRGTPGHSPGAALAWEPSVPPVDGLPDAETSAPIGRALRRLLTTSGPDRPAEIHLDLAGAVVHDAGAGLLAELGATADAPLDRGASPLGALGRLDLAPVRALLGATRLIGVVPESELSALLLGLRGITSRRGRAIDADAARMLAVDAALERFAGLVAPDRAAAPGSGACGGLGFAILGLGGRLVTGPSVTLATTTTGAGSGSRPDLVLTGCPVFDFARRGGGVVAEVARSAGERLAPCVVLAGEVYVGAREMRTMGIEAAYAVRAAGAGPTPGATAVPDGWAPDDADLAALATRVARTWRW